MDKREWRATDMDSLEEMSGLQRLRTVLRDGQLLQFRVEWRI